MVRRGRGNVGFFFHAEEKFFIFIWNSEELKSGGAVAILQRWLGPIGHMMLLMKVGMIL